MYLDFPMFLTFYSNRVRKPTGDNARWGRSTGGYRVTGIPAATAYPPIWRRGSHKPCRLRARIDLLSVRKKK